MRRSIAILLAALALAAALAACGSSSDETTAPSATTSGFPQAPAGATAQSCSIAHSSGGELRVTGVPCPFGRSLVSGWYKDSKCSATGDASRTSCKLGQFNCLGAVTDRGIAVSCAGPGRSVSFLAKRPD